MHTSFPFHCLSGPRVVPFKCQPSGIWKMGFNHSSLWGALSLLEKGPPPTSQWRIQRGKGGPERSVSGSRSHREEGARQGPPQVCVFPTLSTFCITLVGTSGRGGRQESLKVKDQREKNGLEDSELPQTERGITVPTPAREPACGSSPGNSRSLIF